MKKELTILALSLTALILFPLITSAQMNDVMKSRVDGLVLKHYIEGIQYKEAHDLGPGSVPYLLEMLSDPDISQYWVNIIVTLGFIESSRPLDSLISFLERKRGEVDGHTFRALLSVPFSIGCIASNGDFRAMHYLISKVQTPAHTPVRWSYRGRKINDLVARKSIIGLSVSGRPEAREELLRLNDLIESGKGPPERDVFIQSIRDGLLTMDRIRNEGRSSIFNPHK